MLVYWLYARKQHIFFIKILLCKFCIFCIFSLFYLFYFSFFIFNGLAAHPWSAGLPVRPWQAGLLPARLWWAGLGCKHDTWGWASTPAHGVGFQPVTWSWAFSLVMGTGRGLSTGLGSSTYFQARLRPMNPLGLALSLLMLVWASSRIWLEALPSPGPGRAQ